MMLLHLHCRRSAGFTIEERDSFTTTILGGVLTDCFRRQHPGIVAYSYYGYRMNMRSKGKGWRLDYNLVSTWILTDSVVAPKLCRDPHLQCLARMTCELEGYV